MFKAFKETIADKPKTILFQEENFEKAEHSETIKPEVQLSVQASNMEVLWTPVMKIVKDSLLHRLGAANERVQG